MKKYKYYNDLDEKYWCDDCDELGIYDCNNCELIRDMEISMLIRILKNRLNSLKNF